MALENFDDWIQFGIKMGWCGPPVCYTHDGLPMSQEEDNCFIEGQDPCLHIVRMYEDKSMKKAIEEYHSASEWRNIYTQVSDSNEPE